MWNFYYFWNIYITNETAVMNDSQDFSAIRWDDKQLFVCIPINFVTPINFIFYIFLKACVLHLSTNIRCNILFIDVYLSPLQKNRSKFVDFELYRWIISRVGITVKQKPKNLSRKLGINAWYTFLWNMWQF